MRKSDYDPLELKTAKHWHEDQCYVDGEYAWFCTTLWAAAADLPVYEVPLVGFNTDIGAWDGLSDSYLDYLSHVKLIMDADLDYPIILDPQGNICDGRHRLGKAIVLGHKFIKVQRLPFMPEADLCFDENGDCQPNNE